MKKSLLLFSILLSCIFSFAQSANMIVTPTTINSGEQLTFKGDGENILGYFVPVGPNDFKIMNPGSPVSISFVTGSFTGWNAFSPNTPSTFKAIITNSSNTPQTVTIGGSFVVNNDQTHTQNPNLPLTFVVTVNPVGPTVFYNDQRSRVFTRNNCESGKEGTDVTYLVEAGKYSSTISKQDANNKAVNELNANGQAYANANGSCVIYYYNTEVSGSFTRNNCASNAVAGPPVQYTVPAGKYRSIVSQADAQSMAQNDVNSNGQAYANTNGTCILVPSLQHSGSGFRGQEYYISVANSNPGDTFVWTVPSAYATILSGQNTSSLVTNLKNVAGTAPVNFTISVVITNSAGVQKTLSGTVTSKFCNNCPNN